MTPETPTPETDAAKLRLDCDDSSIAIYTHTQDGSCYEGDVCRADETARLERERDAARAEIKAMQEAIKEAHTTLEGIAIAKPSEWGEMSDQFKPWAQNRARHALAKLKPFTKP